MNRVVLNFLAFQIGWWSCVLGASRGWPWLGPVVVLPLLAYHLSTFTKVGRELLFLVIVAIGGTATDTLFALSGLVSYRGGFGTLWPAPAWITALWFIFGTTLHVSMRWLADRLKLAFVLGALAGPSTYYGAARLGAADIGGTWSGWLALGLAWGVALPVLMWLSTRRAFRPEVREL